MKSEFFSPLYTKNSECIKRNSFKTRNTILVPDFFVIFFCITLFLPSIILDGAIMYILIMQGAWGPLVALLLCFCLHSFCEIFINTSTLDEHSNRPKYFLVYQCNQLIIINKIFSAFSCSKTFLFLIYLFGYGPIIICLKILILNHEIWKNPPLDSEDLPLPVFYVPNENFSILKTFCFIYVVLKCIPEIFILCILLSNMQISENIWFILTGCVLINIAIFSHMMASLLPIRGTPAYFLSSGCVVLNGIVKYFAAVCACCVHVEIFSMAFREVGYYALLVHVVPSFIWMWPCWQVLQSQPIALTSFQFGTFCIFFIIIFGFIYIHPFENQGLIYYYLFNLITLLSEMYLLYRWCNPNTLEITYYLCLKVFFFVLLSCFAMINIILRTIPPQPKISPIKEPDEIEKPEPVEKPDNIKHKDPKFGKIKIYFY